MLVVMITLHGPGRAILIEWEEDARAEGWGGQKKDGARVEGKMNENNDKGEKREERKRKVSWVKGPMSN